MPTDIPAPRIDPIKFKVAMLSLCTAIGQSGNSLMVSSTGIAAALMLDDKALATLPFLFQHIANMSSTFPASFLMRRFGRQRGFLLGATVGVLGGALCMLAVFLAKFWLLCLGTACVGVYICFANYYRFAAADLVPWESRAKVIAIVMAGGVASGFIGPTLASYTYDLFAPVLYAGVYLGLIGLYVTVAVMMSFIPMPAPSVEEIAGPQRSLRAIMSQRDAVVAVACASISFGVMAMLMTATPLAMAGCGFTFNRTTDVIQWHVWGMFVPSFFTGHLIGYFGLRRVMGAGVLLFIAAIAIAVSGLSFGHFFSALTLIGVGWNFLFVGGTTLLTTVYTTAERAKVQAANDFMVFGTVAVASLLAGILQAKVGWETLNYAALPIIGIAGIVVLALRGRRGGGGAAIVATA